jgi:hypothetical protein
MNAMAEQMFLKALEETSFESPSCGARNTNPSKANLQGG